MKFNIITIISEIDKVLYEFRDLGYALTLWFLIKYVQDIGTTLSTTFIVCTTLFLLYLLYRRLMRVIWLVGQRIRQMIKEKTND